MFGNVYEHRKYYIFAFLQSYSMSDIFEDKLPYPMRVKFKSYFKEYYDSVFVAFMPFYKVEDVKKGWLDFDIPDPNDRFSPSDKEIYEKGSPVLWETVIKEAGFKDESELCKALKTCYGAFRPVFRRDDLVDTLVQYEDNQDVSRPREDSFGVLSKIAIYNSFKLLGKNEIIFMDPGSYEMIDEPILLSNYTPFTFSKAVSWTKAIYSADKELLFTIYWDQPFFLIATPKSNLDKLLAQNYFEGFICDEDTDGDWDYEKEELERLLEEDKKWREEMTLKYRNTGPLKHPVKQQNTHSEQLQNIKPDPLPKDWWKFWKGLF